MRSIDNYKDTGGDLVPNLLTKTLPLVSFIKSDTPSIPTTV